MMNQIVQGVLLGGYYALIASGLAFLYSVMGVINLAHGSFAILAAYLLYVLGASWQIGPFAGLLIVLPVMGLLGILLQTLVLERALKGGQLLALLATFGIAIVLDNAMFEQFGANTRSLAPFIGDLSFDSWDMGGGIYIGKLAMLTFVVAVGVLGGLQLVLTRTAIGRNIRATAQDGDTAGLVGIDARWNKAIAAAMAMMTAGLAGAFLGMRVTFGPYAGTPQLLFAFQAVVIGGTGGVWNTLAGGIVLALAQSLGSMIHPQGFLIAGNLVFLLALAIRVTTGDSMLAVLARFFRRQA